MVMAENSVHWSDVMARELLKSDREHVVATGITPSGNIHIGNLREVITADAVYRSLLDMGADARLIYVADTFDPLRHMYPFLPDSYEEHIGKPISEIPDPEGCCTSYAEHFLLPFLASLEKTDIRVEPYRADEMYKQGQYVNAIKTALQKRDNIAGIIDEVSGKETPADWSPFNPICEHCGRLTTTKVTDYDLEKETVDYKCDCGGSGTVSMSGGGKLTWRVDWPARWKILEVTVEPFGKDHAAAGSSYDSGTRLAREIFEYEPPYPIPFEHIHLKGKGKMSSSAGIAVPVEDIVDTIPSEVLKHIVTRIKPEKHIDFEPGMKLLDLIDEYDQQNPEPGKVPFRHMVSAVQIARGDEQQLLKVLERSGYDTADVESIRRRAAHAEHWLEKFAPDFAKFRVQETLPDKVKDLDSKQKDALGTLAERFESGEWDAEKMHSEVYTVAEKLDVDVKQVFNAIYTALLGQSSGPRAGWFLMSLDRDFVIKRFYEASEG